VLMRMQKSEGMNPHIPKWTPILGVGVPMDSRFFRGWLQGWEPIGLNDFLYHWKAIETHMCKLGLHDPFGHLKHKLWLKEGPKVKLAVWFPDIVSSSLINSNVSLKWKQRKSKELGHIPWFATFRG
jgi:hypothetical protein